MYSTRIKAPSKLTSADHARRGEHAPKRGSVPAEASPDRGHAVLIPLFGNGPYRFAATNGLRRLKQPLGFFVNERAPIPSVPVSPSAAPMMLTLKGAMLGD